MIPAWCLAPAIGGGIIAGFALCLVVAAVGLRNRPMATRRHTGDLPPHLDDEPFTVEQLLRDADGQGR